MSDEEVVLENIKCMELSGIAKSTEKDEYREGLLKVFPGIFCSF